MSEEMTITKDTTIENETLNKTEEKAPIPEAAVPEPILSVPASDAPKPLAPEAVSASPESPVSGSAPQASQSPKHTVSDAKPDDLEDVFPEDQAEDRPRKRRFFRSRSADEDFSRDKWILSRIDDEHLMEYLTLEQKRFEQLQNAKEKRERRLFTAFRLTISLAAVVAVTYFLKDNPTVLVNILYIAGILAAIWFIKNPKDKEKEKSTDK